MDDFLRRVVEEREREQREKELRESIGQGEMEQCGQKDCSNWFRQRRTGRKREFCSKLCYSRHRWDEGLHFKQKKGVPSGEESKDDEGEGA